MAETNQDPGSIETYLDPWTKRLAAATAAAGTTITLTTATVTASDGATVSSTTPFAAGVRFRLNTSGVTGWPKDITTTTTATLSNGDTVVGHHTIQVAQT